MSSKPIIVVLDDFERVATEFADWSDVHARADVRIHRAPLRGDALLQALARRYPLQAITGHEHVAPGRKHDPGPGFEWQRLQSAFAGSGILFPPTIRAA